MARASAVAHLQLCQRSPDVVIALESQRLCQKGGRLRPTPFYLCSASKLQGCQAAAERREIPPKISKKAAGIHVKKLSLPTSPDPS